MTQSAIDIKASEGLITLRGVLNAKTVAVVWEEVESVLPRLMQFKINGSELERTDSAGLALLIEIYRYAKKNHKPIHFQNLPSQVLEMAKLSGIDRLLRENSFEK